MAKDRLYRTEAIVLRRMDMGEADRLITLYTPYLGKLRVLAKGVRKPTSRKAGHLELFVHSQLLIARGRSLDIVTQAETIEPFLSLREDLLRTSYAYYLSELVERFTEEGEENPALFTLLLDGLGCLDEAPDPASVARYFELHLLELVGYRPELNECVGCRREVKGGAYFSAGKGGVLCQPCSREGKGASPLSEDTLYYLRLLQGGDYQICQVLAPSPRVRGESEKHMRRYISYILERRPKSLAFLDTLRRQEREVSPP